MKPPVVWPVLDDYGLHKVPLRFYWLLVLLLRPYICWVLVLTLPEAQRDMLALFYPQQSDFILACLISSPLLLLLAAQSQRKPKGAPRWRYVWRHGRILLLLVTITDLVLTMAALPSQVMLDAPWRILSPLALMLALLWLVRSATLPAVFAEWPETSAKKAP